MPEITCASCGTAFDTDREPSTPGASTDRCPACGTQADPDADATETATVEATAPVTVCITIEVSPAGDR